MFFIDVLLLSIIDDSLSTSVDNSLLDIIDNSVFNISRRCERSYQRYPVRETKLVDSYTAGTARPRHRARG